MNTNATTTVSSYLDKRVKRLESSLEELRGARQSLFKAKAENDNTSSPVPAKQLQDRTAIALNTIRELLTKLRVLKRQRRTIEADIEEDAEVIKMELAMINGDLDQNTPADIDIYELACANALKTRISTMSETPPLPTKQERAKFLDDVLNRYNAVDYIDPTPESRREYCHLTGWWDTGKVVATQLVPATLAGDGAPLHFGVREMPTLSNDPMNAISLHKNIAGALEKGLVAIVPVRDGGDNSGDEGIWECILVDKSISEEVAVARLYHTSDIKEVNVHSTLWKDLNTLEFNNANRPAKRYLYFRFMITYIKAKMEGYTEFTSAVEEKVGFWKAPGQYLERSTLKALAHSFSGLELSESVIEGQTFVDETVDDAEREEASEILADKLREFFENVEVDGGEDSEEEDDEEEEED